MSMEILEYPGATVMGIEVVARWQDLGAEVSRAWGRVFASSAELPVRASGQLVEVSLEITEGRYRELLGAVVDRSEPCPDGFSVVRIAPQRLLFHRHEGPVVDIAKSFGAMLAWAEREGNTPTDFKLDVGYTPTGEETAHDLYVGLDPVMPWHRVRGAAQQSRAEMR
ncbi:effector binding domain-containing protein [Nocardia sp. 004]|uniref:effector binding domain-containing protein n=1 Tax=Nocardia sp. 004 TaxID=3385978 RepID=UPI0039A3915D